MFPTACGSASHIAPRSRSRYSRLDDDFVINEEGGCRIRELGSREKRPRVMLQLGDTIGEDNASARDVSYLPGFEISLEIFICVILALQEQSQRPRYWNDVGALMGPKLAKNKASASVLQPATDSAASCSSCCARISLTHTHTHT